MFCSPDKLFILQTKLPFGNVLLSFTLKCFCIRGDAVIQQAISMCKMGVTWVKYSCNNGVTWGVLIYNMGVITICKSHNGGRNKDLLRLLMLQYYFYLSV